MGKNWKWAAGLAALALIAGALLFLKRPARAPLSQREVATQVLADHVRKVAAPKAVLIVSNPYSQTSGMRAEAYAFQKASEAGLREGFGPQIEMKIAFPKLKQDWSSAYVDPNSTTPLSYIIADNAFDELIHAHAQCDVIVSLIGLPANPMSLMANTKRFSFILPDFKLLGDFGSIRQAFKSGKIIAAVIPKPGAPPVGTVAASNYKAEFDKRYILVTAENLEQHLPLLLR